MMHSHTPLSWKYKQKEVPEYELETTIVSEGEIEIAVLLNTENETDNAKFIVLACNNHYIFLNLLAKIKKILDETPMSNREYESTYNELKEILQQHTPNT